jgi:threonine aldolase
VLSRGHGIHYPKPGALTLTQATEWGTLYSPAEIAQLSAIAHGKGMAVHMDGARFANAAATLRTRSASVADFTWRAGVDVLSFGGTKNGMLGTEAVVFFDTGLGKEFAYRVKQGGQLASKQRFAAAQWCAMLENGAWLKHAEHANRAARKIADGLRSLPGARLLAEPEANGVFIVLPLATAEKIWAKGWQFHRFIGEDGYRFMGSWATQDADIEGLLADARS